MSIQYYSSNPDSEILLLLHLKWNKRESGDVSADRQEIRSCARSCNL